MPKYIQAIETVIDFWISNTPKFMQPNFVWNIYYFVLDKT